MDAKSVTILSLVGALAIVSGVFFLGTNQALIAQDMDNTSWVRGHFTLVATDAYGEVFAYQQTDNLVVDQGLDSMADLVWPDINLNGNATDNKFNYINIGIGGTAPTATDTTLQTLIAGCLRQLDTAVTGTSAVSGEITATVDFAFDGGLCTGTIQEAAVFNSGTGAAAAAGEMLARATFGGIAIAGGDTLTVTYDVTIT